MSEKLKLINNYKFKYELLIIAILTIKYNTNQR